MVSENVRGGTRVRKKYLEMLAMKNSTYTCTVCGKKSVKRVSAAVWQCRSCKTKFAGGMYTFRTSAGIEMSRRLEAYNEGRYVEPGENENTNETNE